jgi:predicted  nucleic acid-binding Zn-ribbon protein
MFAAEESTRDALRANIQKLEEYKKTILDQMEGAMGGYKEMEEKTQELAKEKEQLAAEAKVGVVRVRTGKTVLSSLGLGRPSG